jgi:hypothetical protein
LSYLSLALLVDGLIINNIGLAFAPSMEGSKKRTTFQLSPGFQ